MKKIDLPKRLVVSFGNPSRKTESADAEDMPARHRTIIPGLLYRRKKPKTESLMPPSDRLAESTPLPTPLPPPLPTPAASTLGAGDDGDAKSTHVQSPPDPMRELAEAAARRGQALRETRADPSSPKEPVLPSRRAKATPPPVPTRSVENAAPALPAQNSEPASQAAPVRTPARRRPPPPPPTAKQQPQEQLKTSSVKKESASRTAAAKQNSQALEPVRDPLAPTSEQAHIDAIIDCADNLAAEGQLAAAKAALDRLSTQDGVSPQVAAQAFPHQPLSARSMGCEYLLNSLNKLPADQRKAALKVLWPTLNKLPAAQKPVIANCLFRLSLDKAVPISDRLDIMKRGRNMARQLPLTLQPSCFEALSSAAKAMLPALTREQAKSEYDQIHALAKKAHRQLMETASSSSSSERDRRESMVAALECGVLLSDTRRAASLKTLVGLISGQPSEAQVQLLPLLALQARSLSSAKENSVQARKQIKTEVARLAGQLTGSEALRVRVSLGSAERSVRSRIRLLLEATETASGFDSASSERGEALSLLSAEALLAAEDIQGAPFGKEGRLTVSRSEAGRRDLLADLVGRLVKLAGEAPDAAIDPAAIDALLYAIGVAAPRDGLFAELLKLCESPQYLKARPEQRFDVTFQTMVVSELASSPALFETRKATAALRQHLASRDIASVARNLNSLFGVNNHLTAVLGFEHEFRRNLPLLKQVVAAVGSPEGRHLLPLAREALMLVGLAMENPNIRLDASFKKKLAKLLERQTRLLDQYGMRE